MGRPKEAVAASYRPKTIRLFGDDGELTAAEPIAALCRQYDAEMREFLAGETRPKTAAAPGTLAWIIDLYQTHPQSPYRKLRPSSLPGYDRSLKIIRATVGRKRIDSATGNDVRGWFARWGDPDEVGSLVYPRRAYGCIQLLRIVVKYGKGQRIPSCRDLSEILTDAEFPAPRGRSVYMTQEQAAAIIAKARELGRPSVALAVALQFGCALRQKDVIGEWLIDGAAKRWQSGLLWGEHIRADWTLSKPTSKSNFRQLAEFDLRTIPPALAELQRVPTTARVGPVVRDEHTGRPWR